MNPEQIKTTREQLQLQQTELAEILGVSHETISRWENGHHKPHGPNEQLLLLLSEADPATFRRMWMASDDTFDLVGRLRRAAKRKK